MGLGGWVAGRLRSTSGGGCRCHPNPPDRLRVEAGACIPSAAPTQGALAGSGWSRHLLMPSILMSHTCPEKFSHSRMHGGWFKPSTLHLDTAPWLPAALLGCRNAYTPYTPPHLLPEAGPHQPRLGMPNPSTPNPSTTPAISTGLYFPK